MFATAAVVDYLTGLRFDPADGPSVVTTPVLVPIPPLEPIRFEEGHALGVEAARARAFSLTEFLRMSGEGLDGVWRGDRFEVICPGPGVLEVTASAVHVDIDMPMMGASQSMALREQLTTRLPKLLAGG